MLARCSQYHKTVTSLSSFMNGRRLLTGSLDHRVKVIDLISYKVTHSMSYTSPILSIASSVSALFHVLSLQQQAPIKIDEFLFSVMTGI